MAVAKKRKREKGERGGKARERASSGGAGFFIDQKTGRIIEITRVQEGGYFRHNILVK